MKSPRNLLFRLSAILLPLLLFIMTPAVGIWMSVGSSGQIERLVEKLLANEVVRANLSSEFADSFLESLDEETRSQVAPHVDELKEAINRLLGSEKLQMDLASIAGRVFTTVATGEAQARIDPTPLVDDLLQAINSVRQIDKISKSEFGDIEPITLGGDAEPLPDLRQILSMLRLVALLTFSFSVICSVGIFRLSSTPWRGISIPFLAIGLTWNISYLIGMKLVDSQLEPGIQANIVPIITSEVLAGIRLISALAVILGILALVTHIALQRRAERPVATQ